MIEKPCKCGKSRKSFQFDIGPFYVGECCEAAPTESAPKQAPQAPSFVAPVAQSPEKIAEIVRSLGPTPSKTALRVHTLAVLAAVAKSRKLEVDGMTRAQILDLLTAPAPKGNQ